MFNWKSLYYRLTTTTTKFDFKMAAECASPVPELMVLKKSQDNTQDANSALWELEKGFL